MKTSDLILLGGLALGGYFLMQKTIEQITRPMTAAKKILTIPKQIGKRAIVSGGRVISIIANPFTFIANLFKGVRK